MKTNRTLIFAALTLGFQNLFCQFNNINGSFTVHFEYAVNGQDSTCNKFYLIMNDHDTINSIDERGRKQDYWMEPYIKYKKVNCKQNFQSYLTQSKLNSIIPPPSIPFSSFQDNNSDSFIVYDFILKGEPKTITYYHDNTCNDNVILDNVRRFDNLNGFYIEAYWFGFIYGKYKDGIRKGRWKYCPKIEGNKLYELTEYSIYGSDRLFKVKKDVSIPLFQGMEVGQYANNERTGPWLCKQHFGNDQSYLLTYKNNHLLHFIKREKNDTFFSVIYNSDHTYIKWATGFLTDISFLAYTFRGYGERFFWEGIKMDDE